MAKLVVLKLDGNLSAQGFRATLEIGEENSRPEIEISGNLPPLPDLATYLNQWQDNYRSLGISSRIKPQDIIYDGCFNVKIQQCWQSANILGDRLQDWLNSEEFRPINNTLREELKRDEPIRVLIRTDNILLQRLPWHLWDFFSRYSQAEFALATTTSEIPAKPRLEERQKAEGRRQKEGIGRGLLPLPIEDQQISNFGRGVKSTWSRQKSFAKNFFLAFSFCPPQYASCLPRKADKSKVRILAILGNSTGIDITTDRKLLENLPNSETVFLVEPKRNELNDYLWQQWDILFFAGHSETAGDTGRIYINKTDSLTIEELKYGLKKAIALGLQLAIFNSCDGLGLARQLASLNIPQMIVMRELVPDEVAQEFLKHFITAFSHGKSLYLASREAREKLQGLEDNFPNATWLPIIFQNPFVTPPTWKNLLGEGIVSDWAGKLNRKRHFANLILASMLVAALVMGVRYLGILQPWELQAYDHLMQLRPEEGEDRRILLVTVDEGDIQYQVQQKMNMHWSLSDRALAQLLQKLDRYQPKAIGIDIYRDSAADPNEPDLINRLQNDNRIFAVCKVPAAEDGEPYGTLPPPEVSQQRLSFSDFVADNDEIPRRQLLNLTPPLTSPCAAKYAFSLQLALHYLNAEKIPAKITPQAELQIGNVVFKPLKKHVSGYQGEDALFYNGYQILLNYRSLPSLENIAQRVSLRDILNDRINPQLIESIKNRIVIIGITASSSTDYWKTPFSPAAPSNKKQIPGVFVQAQMVSHILSAVLDKRPLLWWWSGWLETLWMWAWSLLGGIITWYILEPIRLVFAVAIALLTLFGICFGVFTTGGWIPLIPGALVLLMTATVLQIMGDRHLRNCDRQLTPLGFFSNSKQHLKLQNDWESSTLKAK
ncbi:MAG: CHASE2 domain-containing protein [Heteroscytonema crispum UTEX LB 1556]